MNARKDEQWLDGELRRVINTSKPKFDAASWKRRHRDAYEALLSRRRAAPVTKRCASCGLRRVVGRLALAAVIFIVAAMALMQILPRRQPESTSDGAHKVVSPADTVSMMSLQMAYRQGGEEALNRKLDRALKELGPRPSAFSAQEILRDLES
ncbi:MAG: hypothetical protein JW993_14975 [Sedimentisphaerales bacterium]|nr:hypothetical protein [Sedimentisphaerales bacterium]